MVSVADLSAVEALEEANRLLADLSAGERIRWALTNTPGLHVVTSSFGVQAAV
ncbi:MAG: phosphoadenosine phosphosulfate reductase, partial [Armatimonadota bacterium]